MIEALMGIEDSTGSDDTQSDDEEDDLLADLPNFPQGS